MGEAKSLTQLHAEWEAARRAAFTPATGTTTDDRVKALIDAYSNLLDEWGEDDLSTDAVALMAEAIAAVKEAMGMSDHSRREAAGRWPGKDPVIQPSPLQGEPELGHPGNPAMFADEGTIDGISYVTVLDGGYNPIEYEIPREQAERDYPAHRPYDELG